MKPRAKFLFFLLPWLLILLIPSLRQPARVMVFGSEYSLDFDTIEFLRLLKRSRPPVPSLTALWPRAASREDRVALVLKAPQAWGGSFSTGDSRRRHAKAVEMAPDDPAVLASALNLAADPALERGAYYNEEHTASSTAWFSAAYGYFSDSVAGLEAREPLFDDELYLLKLPAKPAPPLGEFLPVENAGWTRFTFPYSAMSGSAVAAAAVTTATAGVSSTTPIGGATATTTPSGNPPKGTATPPPPLFPWTPESDGPSNIICAAGPPAMRPETFRHATAGLAWARRGAGLEPDNGWWDWVSISFLFALRRDGEVWPLLHSATGKPRFDDHADYEKIAALRTARLHRPLLFEEVRDVWTRQEGGDRIAQQRACLLVRAVIAEKHSGQTALAAQHAAQIARFAARLQETATNQRKLLNGLFLQGASWAAVGGPVQRSPTGFVGLGSPQRQFSVSINNLKVKPMDFARQFASVARRAGRADLADEALQLANEAAPRQKLAVRMTKINDWPSQPELLARLRTLNLAALVTLQQAELALLAWCATLILLWPPIWKLGRFAVGRWHVVALLWGRGRQLQEVPAVRPPEETLMQRDLRLSLWLGALFTALCGAGVMCWGRYFVWPQPELWGLSPQWKHLAYEVAGPVCELGCVLSPLFAGILVAGFAPLWRGQRAFRSLTPRNSGEIFSLRPHLWAFVGWSLVFYAAAAWLLLLLRESDVFDACQFAVDIGKSSLPFRETLSANLLSLSQWVCDLAGATQITAAAVCFWLLKCHAELPVAWRLAVAHETLRCLHRTAAAWLVMAGWLFLIFLSMAMPARQSAESQLAMRIEQGERIDGYFWPRGGASGGD